MDVRELKGISKENGTMKMPEAEDMKVEISPRTGKPMKRRNKRKKKTAPTKSEWAKLQRMMYENFELQLGDRDDDGMPTANPSLYQALNKITHSSEVVFVSDKKDVKAENDLGRQLTEKRKKRKLLLPIGEYSDAQNNAMAHGALDESVIDPKGEDI